MKHIAYITTEYPHTKFPPVGGIGSFVKTMADSLIGENTEVTVFVCLSDEDAEWMDGKIRIIQIKKARKSKIDFLIDRYRINRVISRYIAKLKIDLIEAPDWEGLHAFCKFNIPLVTRIHGSVTYFNALLGRKNSRIMRFLERQSFQNSSSVVAVSDFSGRMTKRIFDFSDFQYTTIYNGVDISKFQSLYDVRTEDNIILYFGTLVRKKGVLEIPDIFAKVLCRLPNVKMILAGKDTIDTIENISTWELMRGKFPERALASIDYLGVIPYDEVSALIQKASVCIFPSFAEAFPIAWLEAMAFGKPSVAYNIGWAKESIEDSISGYLVNAGDNTMFSERIVQLLTDKHWACKIGENARCIVRKKFNQKDIVKQNIDFYSQLICE